MKFPSAPEINTALRTRPIQFVHAESRLELWRITGKGFSRKP
jgi:hypothetical protein